MNLPFQQVSVRLDDAIIARLDALIPVVSTLRSDGTRSDVLREAILLGLEHFERELAGGKRTKTEPT